MKINKVHIMFEQSATFKNEFNKLGYNATTYDIENQFNKTDNVVDLFNEIENAYDNKNSIFDNISSDDMIVAFYPCTWFSVQNELIYSRKAYNFRTWNDEKIDKYISKRKKERERVYSIMFFTNYIQLNNESLKKVKDEHGINRSLMHGDFANNFIRKYILGK